MSSVDYGERIPNNVLLADDRALQRALEHWRVGINQQPFEFEYMRFG